MAMTASQRQERLEYYYHQIKSIILKRQNPISGLLPASTAITAHGDYTDAWVRDNVYSILAVWGLALAYRKIDAKRDRTYELEHSVIKLMRGLLFAMMRQSHKVENFKKTQSPLDALHAKYNTQTGDIVVGDDEWGHLQLDATSIFILILAQMTASGLNIIFTLDEVNFVQNLVYYIGRAYRTPDYGIWERGNKINHGKAELNASSVGMAKAALEAINGCNLFGISGSQASVIHVLPDEIARTRTTLESILPRESSSKEVDAALLSVISFPAFAVEDREIRQRTKQKIIEKLQGNYGCKRFLRDGHQTILEDTKRLHYEPHELKQFEHIESEWPLFFTYLFLDGLFQRNSEQTQEYKQRLNSLLVESDGYTLLPELYYVPKDKIEAEKQNPHSQTRLPNENIPLVWAQSLYFVGQLLEEKLIELGDIDPLNRHLSLGHDRESLVQIALLAEDEKLQAELADQGIATQTPKQVTPISIRQAKELALAYSQIGRNDALGLTGRPIRRLRSLTTSRVFQIRGETIVFLPAFLDQQEFYLTLDYHFLVFQIKSELAYIHRHWSQLGRPTMTLLLTHTMLETGREAFLNLIKEMRDGSCQEVPVKLANLNQFILTAGTERIDFLHDFEFDKETLQEANSLSSYLGYNPEQTFPLSHTQEFQLERQTDHKFLLISLRNAQNLYEQVELLRTLIRLKGLDFDTGFGGYGIPVTVADLLKEIYVKAGNPQSQIHWAVVRYSAGLLNKVDISLSDAVTDILVRGKQVTVGKAYSEDSVISQPSSYTEIMEKIRLFCSEDIRERVLTQEILIYLGLLIKSEPDLFKGLLTLRVSYFILLITSELANELEISQNEAYEKLMQLSPFEIRTRLREVLAGYEGMNQVLRQQELLHLKQSNQMINWEVLPVYQDAEMPTGGWRRKRQKEGSLNRVPKDFYPKVWGLLQHCKGLIIGDKLERRNRLDSDLILSEMTPGEKNFALQVEHLLNKISAAEYRQVNIEALMELAEITQKNPELQIEEYIVLDVLIGHAVRLNWLDQHYDRARKYDQDKAIAWQSFYETSPYVCGSYIVKAFRFLAQGEVKTA
jgi:phosphorylase kinase alpha/beta subunit